MAACRSMNGSVPSVYTWRTMALQDESGVSPSDFTALPREIIKLR